MMISLPTGTKIFNWLCTYLNIVNCYNAALFTLIFLLMFTIGGSTGVILGNAVVDIALHDTYYVVAHFHFVLSLGAVIAIFSGIMYFQEKISGKPETVIRSLRYHFIMTFFGILLTFTPMHFLGFNDVSGVEAVIHSKIHQYFSRSGMLSSTRQPELSIHVTGL